MEKEYDKQTFKFKKKPKKRDKDKESNSSRDSLELTIQSYKNNNQISQKVTEKGENIKFFFNDISTNKNNRFATASNRKSPKININQQKEKEEFDFREILLNYVNQTGRTENKSHAKEKNSVIFSKPNEILTLNGESDTNNNNEFSGQISESSSEYKLNNSKRKSLSYSSTDKKTEKIENINNKIKGNKNKNKKKVNNSNIFIQSHKDNKRKANLKSSIIINYNKNENIKNKKVTILNNDNINNKIKGSNTFTTGANTFNTQNTQHSSFKSLQINLKKFNYDYLNLADISLKKKIMIHNKKNSGNKINNKNIITSGNMFDKLRNINISLEIEKSYSNYFKQIIKLQQQKNNYKESSFKKATNSCKETKTKNSSDKQYNKRYFYYPDEYYLDKNSDLHSKSHVSKLFEKLRKKS